MKRLVLVIGLAILACVARANAQGCTAGVATAGVSGGYLQIMPNPSVRVYLSDGVTPAVVYTTIALNVVQVQPFTGNAYGAYSFCAVAGQYVISMTGYNHTVTVPVVIGSISTNAVQIQGKTVDVPIGVGTQATYNSNSSGKITWQGKLVIDARDYGAVADNGVTDNTPALNAAATAACAIGGAAVQFAVATSYYGFATKPNPIGCGSWVVGGGNGSTNSAGTSLVYTFNETTPTNGFLTWDGSYLSNKGTGGGLANISLYKMTNNGGAAIKLTGSDDNHRAGFFTISDVVVSGSGGAQWNKDLLIDGSCCTTLGGQGIRDVHIRNFWAAVASDGDAAILFNNAVQVMWYGGEIFPAGVGTPGITITGAGAGTSASTNIFLSDVYIIGNVVTDFAANVHFNVAIGGDFTSSANTTTCQVFGSVAGTITNNAACGMIGAMNGTSQIGSLKVNGGLQFTPAATGQLGTGTASNRDLAGQLTLSTGTATYNFLGSYGTAPICTCSDVTAANACKASSTTTVLTVTGTGSDVVNYHCVGRT